MVCIIKATLQDICSVDPSEKYAHLTCPSVGALSLLFGLCWSLALAHQSSQRLSCFYTGELLASLVIYVECLAVV